MSTTVHRDLPLAAQFGQVPGTSRRVEIAAGTGLASCP
jgi:hypothetical protein